MMKPYDKEPEPIPDWDTEAKLDAYIDQLRKEGYLKEYDEEKARGMKRGKDSNV